MTAVLSIGMAIRSPAQSAGLMGSYGFALTQTFDGGDLPGALIGILTFDGAGNLTGSATNVGVVQDPNATAPRVSPSQFGGTYTVNPDGTGVLIGMGGGLTNTIAFVITDGGAGLMLLPSAGFGNHLLTGTARLAAPGVGLKGSYGFTLTQAYSGGNAPLALMGALTFDGAGNVTGTRTTVGVDPDPNATTVQVQSKSGSGTYTVNADGTGTLMLQGGQTIAFVVTDGGAGVMLLATGGVGNFLFTGTARKQ